MLYHSVEVFNGKLGIEAVCESTDDGVPVISDACRCVVEDCQSIVDASEN